MIPAQEMGDCLPMLPPTRALILRELFQVWKNREEVQPGVERGPWLSGMAGPDPVSGNPTRSRGLEL